MPKVWHVFSFYNSTFAKREVKEVREFKEFKGVKAICFIAKYTNEKGCPNHLEQPSTNQNTYIIQY